MKRLLICFLVLGLLLSGCGAEAGLLEYPGLQWGMTFEEVRTVLGFSEGDILDSRHWELDPERPAMPGSHDYTVEGLEMFGFPTAQVVLRFHEYTGHEPGLAEMVVYYPDGYEGGPDTDVEELRRVVKEHYGERVMAVPSVHWDERTGELVRKDYPYTGDDICYWLSGTTAREHLSEEELRKLYDAVIESRRGSDYSGKLPSFEQFCQTLEEPATMLGLEIEEDADALRVRRQQGQTSLRLFFDGELLVNIRAADRYYE